MMKLSSKWSPNIIPSRGLFCGLAVVSMLLQAPGTICTAGNNADATAAASALAAAADAKFGSPEAIQKNASQPLTSDNTPMSSLNGQQTGTAQLLQPSSKVFLSVVLQPMATGDLTNVLITQDLDFDGNIDYQYAVPNPISGICANGTISCSPGTWTNCQTYAWLANAQGQAQLVNTSLDQLGGCFCINQSCGSNLVWNNIGYVMSSLGGGIVGAIESSKSGISISEAQSDGPSISYYGQDTTAPSATQIGTGKATQTAYYTSPGSISGATNQMVLTQSQDPNSYYSMMQKVLENKGGNGSYHTCKTTRVVNVSGPNCTIGTYDPLKQLCENIVFTHNNGSDASFNYSGQMTVLAGDQVYFMLVKDYADGCQDTSFSNSVQINGTSIGTLSASSDMYCWHIGDDKAKTITYTVPADGTADWHAVGHATDYGDFYITSHYTIYFDRSYSCQSDEYIDDQCAALTSNPDCSLSSETVDGVLVYNNFNATNLTPLPSTKSFTADICSKTVTRDWWVKDKTYLCKSPSTFDLSNVGQRVSTVTKSVEANDAGQFSFNYDDKRQNPKTGAWTQDSHQLDISTDIQAGEGCEKVCKTKKTVEATNVAPTGPTTTYRTSNLTYDFLYRPCGTENVCPAGPGEEIIVDCQCQNDFNEVFALMGSIQAAGHDMICSDGVKK